MSVKLSDQAKKDLDERIRTAELRKEETVSLRDVVSALVVDVPNIRELHAKGKLLLVNGGTECTKSSLDNYFKAIDERRKFLLEKFDNSKTRSMPTAKIVQIRQDARKAVLSEAAERILASDLSDESKVAMLKLLGAEAVEDIVKDLNAFKAHLAAKAPKK